MLTMSVVPKFPYAVGMETVTMARPGRPVPPACLRANIDGSGGRAGGSDETPRQTETPRRIMLIFHDKGPS